MESNVGNVEFVEDVTAMSNGGSNGVSCEYLFGFSVVEIFCSICGCACIFHGLALTPPLKGGFFC